MGWVKVDDGFPDHPKALELDLAASGLWVYGLCYANRQRTDGFIPTGFLRRVGDDDAVDAAERLVTAGLWEAVEGGWRIHDYAEHQRTREQIEDVSQKRAEAGRRGAEAKHRQVASSLPEGRQNTSKQTSARRRTQEEQEPEENAPSADGGRAARAATTPNPAYLLFQAFCDELGIAEEDVKRDWKQRQIGLAAQLLDAGYSEADVRAFLRYLPTDPYWSGKALDLGIVRSQIGTWVANKRPAAFERTTGPPAATRTNGRQVGGYTADELLSRRSAGR